MDCTTNKIKTARKEHTCFVICYSTFCGQHYVYQDIGSPIMLSDAVLEGKKNVNINCGESSIDLDNGKKFIICGYFFVFEELSDACWYMDELKRKKNEWIKYGIYRCKTPIGTKYCKGTDRIDFPWYKTIKVVCTKDLKFEQLVWW